MLSDAAKRCGVYLIGGASVVSFSHTSPCALLRGPAAPQADVHTRTRTDINGCTGSFPEKDGGKLYNTSLSFGPTGALLGKHRKIHLFDVDVPGRLRSRRVNTGTRRYARLSRPVCDCCLLVVGGGGVVVVVVVTLLTLLMLLVLLFWSAIGMVTLVWVFAMICVSRSACCMQCADVHSGVPCTCTIAAVSLVSCFPFVLWFVCVGGEWGCLLFVCRYAFVSFIVLLFTIRLLQGAFNMTTGPAHWELLQRARYSFTC